MYSATSRMPFSECMKASKKINPMGISEYQMNIYDQSLAKNRKKVIYEEIKAGASQHGWHKPARHTISLY